MHQNVDNLDSPSLTLMQSYTIQYRKNIIIQHAVQCFLHTFYVRF